MKKEAKKKIAFKKSENVKKLKISLGLPSKSSHYIFFIENSKRK